MRERKSQELGEPVTVDMLQQMYKAKAQQAESTKNEFTDNFVGNSVMIYDKVLLDEGCNAVLEALEVRFGHSSCFNSAAKLKILVDKTEDLEIRRFVLQSFLDNIESGQTANEQAGKFSSFLSSSVFQIGSIISSIIHSVWQARQSPQEGLCSASHADAVS